MREPDLLNKRAFRGWLVVVGQEWVERVIVIYSHLGVEPRRLGLAAERGGALKSQLGGRRDPHHASPGSPETHRRPSRRVHDAQPTCTPLPRRARQSPAPSTETPAPERSGGRSLSDVTALSINPARRHGPRTSILKPIERQCGRRHAPLDTPLSETPTDDWLGSPFTQGSRLATRRPGAPRSLR